MTLDSVKMTTPIVTSIYSFYAVIISCSINVSLWLHIITLWNANTALLPYSFSKIESYICGVCVHMCVCLHLEARDWFSVSSLSTFNIMFWERTTQLTCSSSVQQDWPMNFRGPLFPPPEHGYISMLGFMCEGWGSKFKSFCLGSKHFTYWTRSLSP